jgi:septal ring factor EnvC (AmiA/AmiB activator)
MTTRLLLIVLFVTMLAPASFAADFESRLNSLEETLKNQQKTIEEQQQLINQLKEELSSVKQQTPTEE